MHWNIGLKGPPDSRFLFFCNDPAQLPSSTAFLRFHDPAHKFHVNIYRNVKVYAAFFSFFFFTSHIFVFVPCSCKNFSQLDMHFIFIALPLQKGHIPTKEKRENMKRSRSPCPFKTYLFLWPDVENILYSSRSTDTCVKKKKNLS